MTISNNTPLLSLAALLREVRLPQTARSMERLATLGIFPVASGGRSKLYSREQLAQLQAALEAEQKAQAK